MCVCVCVCVCACVQWKAVSKAELMDSKLKCSFIEDQSSREADKSQTEQQPATSSVRDTCTRASVPFIVCSLFFILNMRYNGHEHPAAHCSHRAQASSLLVERPLYMCIVYTFTCTFSSVQTTSNIGQLYVHLYLYMFTLLHSPTETGLAF